MSLLSRLPPKDLERLSAYLDRELPPREAAELEARLRADPDLRRAHEELRQLAVAVRALGEVKVPRNFLVRDADVRRPTKAGYPALRFATALASLAFVLLAGARLALPLGAAAPAALMAGAPESEMALRAADAVEATFAPPAEIPAEAPLPAAPESGALAALATATAAPTPVPGSDACPTCPTNEGAIGGLAGEEDLLSESGELAATAQEEKSGSEVTAGISWLAAGQWILGGVVVILLVLTLRARRG